MKRRRRPDPTPKRILWLVSDLWGGPVIPPKSIVRLKDATDWLDDKKYRIGYYSRMDGLNSVWLVNDEGKYEQTVDQSMIRDAFEVLERSDETDIYGVDQAALEPLKEVA